MVQNVYEGFGAIRFLPEEERPRERLLREGERALALWELLAILLGSGTKGKSAIGLARELLMRFQNLEGLLHASIVELMEVKGIGKAKAIQLKAALGIAQRTYRAPVAKQLIDSSQKAYQIARYEIEAMPQEELLVILRDTKRRLIHAERIARGTLSEVTMHPREIFHLAIRYRAYTLIVAHNHPSGDPTPSAADLQLTELLVEASLVVGIPLIDHLIIGRAAYTSLRDKGFFFRLPHVGY